MSHILELGRRVELQSMDPHCDDITIALYRDGTDGAPSYRVHSYSSRPGAEARVAAIVSGMAQLGGLQVTADGALQSPCGADHPLAIRRLFLDTCKLEDAGDARPFELSIVDRKSGLTIEVKPEGEGQYRVTADTDDASAGARRVGVIVNGLKKLGEMLGVQDADGQVLDDCVCFACGHDHHELVALLLQRAPNVRALVREQEAAAARGVLAAPSAQQ